MLEYKVIEKANNLYISPLVTFIKKDHSVRLRLDSQNISKITVTDHEGQISISEILSNCSDMKV